MVFFWACEVTETKAAAVEVPEGFVLNVCNATAGSLALGDASLGVETLQMDKQPWKGVVAHLGKTAGAFQVKLDLVFSQKAKFYLAMGSGKVHVTGYFQPGPPSDMFEADIPLIVGEAKPAADSHKSKKRAREATAITWDQVSERVQYECSLRVVRVCGPICKLPPRLSVQRGSRPFGIGTSSLYDESSSCLYTRAWSLRLSPRGGRRGGGRSAVGSAKGSGPEGVLVSGNIKLLLYCSCKRHFVVFPIGIIRVITVQHPHQLHSCMCACSLATT